MITLQDVQKMFEGLLNGIIQFLTWIVPVKLPGDIELAVWAWGLIISAFIGTIALILKKNWN